MHMYKINMKRHISMIGILVMILCVQAAILFVRLCIRRKQKKIELK